MSNEYFQVPVDYVEQYVHQYAGYVKTRSDGRLNGGCPLCREGDSWGKKRRFWYDSNREGRSYTVQCYNCGYANTSIGFICDVSGLTFGDIKKECQDYDVIPKDAMVDMTEDLVRKNEHTLPKNSINLLDEYQVSFYEDDPILKIALKYIKDRRLDKAINKPKSLYLSLEDYIHKDRLILPYYYNGKIVWYQSRKLVDDDSPKYLSKANSSKSLSNVDNIDPEYPYIFLFEGAIDSYFVKNSTCVSGITEEGEFTLTDLQQTQLNQFPFHNKVWVLDSPYLDNAAMVKTKSLMNKGELVFNWPEKIGTVFKDFNDMVVRKGINKIPCEFITGNLKEKKKDLSSVINELF